MADVNITQLRQNLPAYLEKARKGHRIRVTSRGKVIAEILAPSASAEETRMARKLLAGSVQRYDRPFDPASDPAEWEISR